MPSTVRASPITDSMSSTPERITERSQDGRTKAERDGTPSRGKTAKGSKTPHNRIKAVNPIENTPKRPKSQQRRKFKA